MYIRECHVGAWIEGHLDDSGAINVDLLAGCCVAAGDPACLVKAVGLHSPGVIPNKHLQHHRLIHSLQLNYKIKKKNDN